MTSVRFSWAGFRAGVAGIAPMAPVAAIFGLVYGALAARQGLSLAETFMTSALVFAGAAQLMVLEFWVEPLSWTIILIAVALVNARHLLMGATMWPLYRHCTMPQRLSSMAVMTDETWGISIMNMRQGGRDAAFLLGAGSLLWIAWVSAGMSGHILGDVAGISSVPGVAFVATAFFASLLAGFWRTHWDLLPWLVAALVSGLTWWVFGGAWHILTGSIVGSLVGLIQHNNAIERTA